MATVLGHSREMVDWPTELLLDELWLCTRRKLIGALQRSCAWMPAAEFRSLRRARRLHGEQLAAELLPQALGLTELQQLRRSGSFGSQLLASRIPWILSFGYDIGAGLAQQRTDDSPACQRAGCICAIFNLAISLFDAICDSQPHHVPELLHLLSEPTLASLNDTPAAAFSLLSSARELDSLEPRIVVRLAADFFRRAWELPGADRAAPTWQLFGETLNAAYRAQLRTLETAAELPAHASMAAEPLQAKSVLPFEAMELVGCLVAPCGQPALERPTGQLGRSIGIVFSLLDDLLDLIRDMEQETTNALITAVDAGPGQVSAERQILSRLLDGPQLTQAITALAGTLGEVRASVTRQQSSSGLPTLSISLIVYIQNWILSDGGDARSRHWQEAMGAGRSGSR